MLAHRQPMISSVRRDAWLEVDLNAIERNIAVIRSWLSEKTRLMGVVKSDGYGHGASGVAEVLQASGVHCLGVASVDEGCQLRESGISLPILLLSPCPSWALANALEYKLSLSLSSLGQVEDIISHCQRTQTKAAVHIKIDTGMHRLGIAPKQLEPMLLKLQTSEFISVQGIFSHFAKADEKDFTNYQTGVFKDALGSLGKLSKEAGAETPVLHLASGEAARRFPETHFDMVRVGLYMYGLEPKKVSDLVYPALSVRARINHIQELKEGESVGYNLSWTSTRKSRLASIPIGYADGVDRGLSNRMKGLLMGREVAQVGLISMDQMLFDITDSPQAEEGDIITLIGKDRGEDGVKEIHLAQWAEALNTITYELACRLRARMPRVYTRQPLTITKDLVD